MESELKQQTGSQELVAGNNKYTYTIRPFTVTNSLGFTRAVLHEYRIVGETGEAYVLHRTKEGSWYEVDKANPSANHTLMLALKIEIDKIENRVY